MNTTGIRADPDKVIVILNIKDSTAISEVKIFLGMVKQLRKFANLN